MITPAYGLTASERVLPRLALDWTTGVAQPGVDVARTSVATFVNSLGVIELASANTQRVDWSTGTAGLLVEEARTNLLLNSLIDGTSLATQSVTVTAAAHTLSFYGTGTVELTGVHTATVNGTGAYPTRTTLTFTPTAGSLTLTVSGTVQFANLELGAFATSFIPTAGAAVLRNADVATMTGTNFSDWYNASEGAFVARAAYVGLLGSRPIFTANTDGSNYFGILTAPSTVADARGTMLTGGVAQTTITVANTFVAGVFSNVCYSYKVDNCAFATKGSTVGTDLTATIPTVNKLDFGRIGATQSSLWIAKLYYYSQRLTNNEVQAFSK